jgi:cytochrome P450
MAIAEGPAAVAAVTKLIETTGRGWLNGSVSGQMAKEEYRDVYPTDADLARALAGCMIGGVPTVAVNAVRLLVRGLDDGTLDRAQRPWLQKPEAERTFKEASDTFGPVIARRLAHEPVPEMLWRRVASDGVELGGKPLVKGRILIFSLESAGRHRRAQGTVDNYIPYGMAPNGTTPTPHGCPGREMANGTLLGLLVGLLDSARFRPGAAPGLATIRPLA